MDASEVLIFATANDDWAPPPELRQFAQTAQEILRQPQYRDDPLSPDAIAAYFRSLYWQRGADALDACDLLGITRDSRLERLPLETIADKFQMIESALMPVVVPYDRDARSALERLRHADKVGGLARCLQPYLVQLPRQAYAALCRTGAVQAVAPKTWGEQFMMLVNMDLYSPVHGITWDDPAFVKGEQLVW